MLIPYPWAQVPCPRFCRLELEMMDLGHLGDFALAMCRFVLARTMFAPALWPGIHECLGFIAKGRGSSGFHEPTQCGLIQATGAGGSLHRVQH